MFHGQQQKQQQQQQQRRPFTTTMTTSKLYLFGEGWFGNSSSSSSSSSGTKKETDNVKVKSEQRRQEEEFYVGKETDYDVIIVGGGCSGVGMSLMLSRTFGLDYDRVLIVEQASQVGDSFRRWPREMKFISPSFNQQGWTNSFDLNAIHYDTSPAYFLRTEHPTGDEYATYLQSIVDQAQLNIRLQTQVTTITPPTNPKTHPFQVQLTSSTSSNNNDLQTQSTTTVTSRYIVWAAGEFQYPKEGKKSSMDGSNNNNNSSEEEEELFEGADLCVHNSRIESYAELEGDEFVIIGGYESGVDAAYHLAQAGKKCQILASTPCWNIQTGDPSTELAPYTASRLKDVLDPNFSHHQPQLTSPIRVISVQKTKQNDDGGGYYQVKAKWKADSSINAAAANSIGIPKQTTTPVGKPNSILTVMTPQPPILCTGFEGSVKVQARHLFDFPTTADQQKKGCIGNGPLLTNQDESTKVPGVFLVGPSVTHGQLSFCFIYKFRQRFAIVANAICQKLGQGTNNNNNNNTKQAIAECRQTNMYMDDIVTCNTNTCGDTC